MKSTTRPVILVAEDHPVNQKVLSLLLNMLGGQGEMVSSGKEVLEAAKNDGYAIILMDIMMPEMDGFEAAFEIRKREFANYCHAPIIACTALDIESIKDQLVRSGIDDYIGKPISRDTLREKIALVRYTSSPTSHEQKDAGAG